MWKEIESLLSQGDPTKAPPKIVIYGDVGAGKTTQIAEAFPHYLWVTTSETALRYAATREDIETPAHRIELLDSVDGDGRHKNNWYHWVQTFLSNWRSSHANGSNTFKGMVISEWGELLRWVHRGIEQTYGKSYSTWNTLADIAKEFVTTSRQCGTGFVADMHRREPQYIEGDEDSPSYGTLKAPGGPDFPSGKMIEDVLKDFEICWELIKKGKSNKSVDRYFLTTADYPKSMRKTRGEEKPKRPLPLAEQLRELGFEW